jgi:hypothetical protein
MSSEYERLINDNFDEVYVNVLSEYLRLCKNHNPITSGIIKTESKISSRQYPNRNLIMSLPIEEIVKNINPANYPNIHWQKSIRENIELQNPGYSVYCYYYNIDYYNVGYCVKLCKNDGFINNIIDHPWIQSIWGGFNDEFMLKG